MIVDLMLFGVGLSAVIAEGNKPHAEVSWWTMIALFATAAVSGFRVASALL